MHCQMTPHPNGKTTLTNSGRSYSLILHLLRSALSRLTPRWPYTRRHGRTCWRSRQNTKVGHILCTTWHIYSPGTVSAKALYRRALAKVALKDDGGARDDLSEASTLLAAEDPLNLKVAISTELAKITQREKELKEKEKRAYKKLFA